MLENYYQVLGLKPGASPEDVATAFRELAHKYHPDVSNDAEVDRKFRTIQKAYEVLRDSETRKRYDDALNAKRKAECGYKPPPPPPPRGSRPTPPPGGDVKPTIARGFGPATVVLGGIGVYVVYVVLIALVGLLVDSSTPPSSPVPSWTPIVPRHLGSVTLFEYGLSIDSSGTVTLTGRIHNKGPRPVDSVTMRVCLGEKREHEDGISFHLVDKADVLVFVTVPTGHASSFRVGIHGMKLPKKSGWWWECELVSAE